MTLPWPTIRQRLQRARQDTGAAVCLPRKPYYLARDQTARQRDATQTLLCQEFGYVQALGRTSQELKASTN